MGRELNPDWWEKAEWWQRAVAHYWAYMGAALEGYNPNYCQLLYTSNKSTIEDIRDQLSASWMEEAVYNVSTFKPSRLSCNGEFNRSDVENLFEFLNSSQSSPWVVSVRQLIK